MGQELPPSTDQADENSESAPAGAAKQSDAGSGEIVARAGGYYRNARYLIVLMCLAMGGWFLYDGFYNWPAERAADLKQGQNPKHSESDILLNQALGLALPPIGILLLGWMLYRSRGVCRLSNNTVYVPGHPPIPLDAIRKIDKRLWERKGIAVMEYESASGRRGQFKLDDFVYQRDPIDRIFERIEAYVQPAQWPEGDAKS